MDETVYSEIMKTLAVMDISSIDKVESDDTIDVELPTRSLRNRSVSESSLHKTRNRKIEKPKKIVKELKTEKEIMNFYKNANKKFKEIKKPFLLETIFETEEHEEIVVSSSKIGRKIKRVIEVGDGLNITKALKEKRKNLIKKHLGNKKRPRKIALAKFMEYFKEKSADSPEKTETGINVQCNTLIISEELLSCPKE